MRRIILLLVSALCYFSETSTLRTNRYRVVRSGRLPEVKQYKRNVKLEERDEEFDQDLRSVLEEVIAETNEEPARITEHLTSRGTLEDCKKACHDSNFRIIRSEEDFGKTFIRKQ